MHVQQVHQVQELMKLKRCLMDAHRHVQQSDLILEFLCSGTALEELHA